MKNKATISFQISNYEAISESSESKLVGGFSKSQSSSTSYDFNTTNNCYGGNCTPDCGDGPIGQNLNCNVAQGCGVIVKQ